MPKQPNKLNLVKLFQTVAGTMANYQGDLNNADTYNHDHGDNMVEVFNVISQAMQEKKGAEPADQLAYASQLLRQRKSGSAQLYSQGLAQASKDFKGQPQVTPNNALTLIQSLMGGGQASTMQSQSGVGDLLGTLLGGGQAAQGQSQAPSQDVTGDLLGMLLGSAAGTQNQPQNQQAPGGLDIGDLLNAGQAFMNTKSQGGNNMQAIVNALVSGSAMSDNAHRSQSGALVVNSLLQAIGKLSGKK